MKRRDEPEASEAAASRGVPWHALEPAEAARRLDVDPARGLAADEVERRRALHGENVLVEARRTGALGILVRQFQDVLIAILLVAAAISLAIGHALDAATILAIALLNAILGFAQEWRAERAIRALERLLAPGCRVRRADGEASLAARELVPGDVVVVETGDRVPADLRLLEALRLRADESALTGESASVDKDVRAVPEDAPLAEQRGMLRMGTIVTSGSGRGVVALTGMATEFGHIARLTQGVERERTPLQRTLALLGRRLGLLGLGVSAGIALTGWLTGRDLYDMFLTGMSLAVAVVPEGLPAVVTITLALGIRAMVRKRALLRRLHAAETLGAATVVCSDKTGTLTRSEMTVRRVWTASREVEVTGRGYEPVGELRADGAPLDALADPELLPLLETGLLCNHAHLGRDASGWRVVGEPTEGALVVLAGKAGLEVAEPRGERETEFGFDSARKRMSVVERRKGALLAHVKGAPEGILERSTRIRVGDDERPLAEADREAFLAAFRRYAEAGLRALALARRPVETGDLETEERVERDLTLLGLVGMLDPPREGVREALEVSRAAGVETLMITGDAPATALAIARQVGLPADRVLTGPEIERLGDDALEAALADLPVLARTSPEHKLRVVDLLQRQGHVVAMTGDGVNDAPALKKADIGIAMGVRGTDVARGASDMVLMDDDYPAIVGAIEEGRRQFANIRKFVRYLLSSNTGEVFALFANILLGGPLVLLPVQILWMNFVTDGLTAVALGVEPAEPDAMRRPPRRARDPLLDKGALVSTLLLGAYVATATLVLFYAFLDAGDPGAETRARTVAFTTIIVVQKFNVLNFRSLSAPLARVGFLSNPWLLAALALNVGLHLLVVYAPPLQHAFGTAPLRALDWGVIVAAAAPIFLLVEAQKGLKARHAA